MKNLCSILIVYGGFGLVACLFLWVNDDIPAVVDILFRISLCCLFAAVLIYRRYRIMMADASINHMAEQYHSAKKIGGIFAVNDNPPKNIKD